MRLADFSLTPTLKDFMDLRTGIVRDYCALIPTDVARRLRAGHDPARQSRAVHLKTNFQLDKQAVRY
jgi:hypothetical protein